MTWLNSWLHGCWPQPDLNTQPGDLESDVLLLRIATLAGTSVAIVKHTQAHVLSLSFFSHHPPFPKFSLGHHSVWSLTETGNPLYYKDRYKESWCWGLCQRCVCESQSTDLYVSFHLLTQNHLSRYLIRQRWQRASHSVQEWMTGLEVTKQVIWRVAEWLACNSPAQTLSHPAYLHKSTLPNTIGFSPAGLFSSNIAVIILYLYCLF